jgi:chromosome partitioning protein
MAKKIAITLRKGGSGKTTTAVNLASALHLLGKKVLLIDLDPQANATLSVGIDPTSLAKNINHLFTTIDTQPQDVIVVTSFGLHLLPSHPDLAQTEAGMKATQVGALKGLLEPLENIYEYIVIDTPPSESYLAVNALAAANEVVIPLQAHFLALQGLSQAMQQVEQVRNGLNPDLKVAGILPTMVNARTNISKNVIDEVRNSYPQYLLPFEVDYSVRHSEATLAGLPIVIYDPTHSGAIAYTKLAQVIL